MRFFNTAGPCDPDKHYMLPPERRLPGVRGLIDREQYFVIHAPRQSGKTTFFRALARRLMDEGRYAALLASCETGQATGDLEVGVPAVLDSIRQAALNQLTEELRPPAADPAVPAATRLQDLLARWSRQSPRPVVLFLDEIDALKDDVLLSVLRQLRAGYADRPGAFPQSVALIGLRDVGDACARDAFNIKVESLRILNFNVEEVGELYDQCTAETGHVFTPQAKALTWELTRGHPGLVNALAKQALERSASDRTEPVVARDIEEAKEILIENRNIHFNHLIAQVQQSRVWGVLSSVLKGNLLSLSLPPDDLKYVEDLGLVGSGLNGLEVANPVYKEIFLFALMQREESQVEEHR